MIIICSLNTTPRSVAATAVLMVANLSWFYSQFTRKAWAACVHHRTSLSLWFIIQIITKGKLYVKFSAGCSRNTTCVQAFTLCGTPPPLSSVWTGWVSFLTLWFFPYLQFTTVRLLTFNIYMVTANGVFRCPHDLPTTQAIQSSIVLLGRSLPVGHVVRCRAQWSPSQDGESVTQSHQRRVFIAVHRLNTNTNMKQTNMKRPLVYGTRVKIISTDNAVTHNVFGSNVVLFLREKELLKLYDNMRL